MKRNTRFLIYLGLIALIIAELAVILVPRFTGLEFDPVVGHSMEPTMIDGSLVAMVKVEPSQIKVGDIIGFFSPEINLRVCHRVVGIAQTSEGYGFLTQGDNNSEPDEWIVSPRDVLGRVYFIATWLAPVTSMIESPPEFRLIILLLTLAALGLLAVEVRLVSKRWKLPINKL